MEQLIKRENKTVLLVSHNIRQVERLCTRAILLDRGHIVADGKAPDICNLFYERSDNKIRHDAEEMLRRARRHATTGDVDLLKVEMLDRSGVSTNRVEYNSEVTVVLTFKANVELLKPMFGLGVHTTDFVYLTTDHTEQSMHALAMTPGIYEVRCKIRRFPFLPGVYALRVGIALGEFFAPVFYAENVFFFQVMSRENKRTQAMQEGFISWESAWSASRVNGPAQSAEPECIRST
jgi:lipopolysaccharide transport system ATP-binding protein